jgi:hypothetical protein
MDKTLIKEVKFSHERRAIVIAFTDGGMYGETGENALKTLKQLNDNDVPYVNLDERNFKSN